MRNLSLLALPLLIAAAPASARDVDVRIGDTRLDRAVAALGRQAGVSIGIADAELAGLRVRRVAGRMSAGEALGRLLGGTRARARMISTGVFVIEVRGDKPDAPRPGPAAPPPDVIGDTELVVTASKRDLPLSDYPGAATVVAGDMIAIAEAGRGTDAIVERFAALTSTHLGPGRNKLFIRGIADSSFTGPTQSTVGQYWGQTRLTYSAPDPGLKLYDVEAVELLEGPQGTLYGAGSLGGIIRVVPRAPQLDAVGGAGWGGAQATLHGDPGGDAGGLVNVPLMAGRLAFRGLVYGGIDGGYIDDRRRELDDVNRVETLGGRAALRFAPGIDWTIDLSGAFQSVAGDDAQYADREGDELSRESAVAQPYRNEIALGELTVTGELGPTRLVSTLGIVDQTVSESFDATVRDDQPQRFEQTSHVRLITSETRLARQERRGGWLVGLHLLRNDTRLNRDMNVQAMVAPAAGVTNRVEEATLYGEATFSPIDPLALTAGARLTHSRLSGSAEDVPVAVAFRNDPGARASRSETRLLPSFAARYRLFDTLSLFARYQQSYRPGGLALHTDFIQRFLPDRVATAEAGLRYRDAANRVALQLTAAHTDWRDIQADIIDGTGFPTTANIGDGRVTTIGASGRWSLDPDFAIDAALYWNESKVTTPAPVLLATLDTRQAAADALPNIADVSARLGFDYRRDVMGGNVLRLRGFARYLGKSTLGIGPDLGKPQGDYLDTGIDVRIGDEWRGLSLSVTNLLDARGNRFALGSPFLVRDAEHLTPLRPLTARIGFDVSF